MTFVVSSKVNELDVIFDYQVFNDDKRIWHNDFILGIKGVNQDNLFDIPDIKDLEYLGNGTYRHKQEGYILQSLNDMADLEYDETLKESW